MKKKHCCPRCGTVKGFVGGIALVFPMIGYYVRENILSFEVKNHGYCIKCVNQLEEHINQWWRNK
jgi:hypothetical protein